MELYYKDLSPPSRAVYATLKTLKLPVTLRELGGFEEVRSEKIVKLNPAHQIPVFVDNGFILTESRAIICYLMNKYSPNNPLYPTDPKARAEIDRMLYFDGTNLFHALKGTFVPRAFMKRAPTEAEMEAGRNGVKELLALKGDYRFMAGNQVSVADISIAMMMVFIRVFLPEEAAKLEAWYKAVEQAVPAVKEINDAIDTAPLKEMLKIV